MTTFRTLRRRGGAMLAALLLAWPAAAAADGATDEAVAAALPELRATIEQAMAEGAVPGLAVAIVHGDEVVFLEGFGVREAGRPGAVDADTVFQLASLSKPMAATVVAALVGEGHLDWQSRIAELDPGFRLHEPYASAEVTVRDLLAHRSGLPTIAGDDLESLGYDRATILERLRLVPPLYSFRGGYNYSNFGFTEGAQAAARAAGLTWEEAVGSRLYAPLGMTSTSSLHADFAARENRAELHVPEDGAWRHLYDREPDPQAPAGGASSSARDMARWLRLLLGEGVVDGRRLVEAAPLARVHEPITYHGVQRLTGQPSFYATGWGTSYGSHGPVWSHAGAFTRGARTFVMVMPDEDLGIVVLANAFPTGLPETIAYTFFDLVFEGAVTQDWSVWNIPFEMMVGPAVEEAEAMWASPPADAAPARPDEAYVGTYANDYFGEAVVAAGADGLELRLGPDGVSRFPLHHFAGDLFVFYPRAESLEEPFGLRFAVAPDEAAGALVIDGFATVGHAAFPRVAG